MWIPYKCKGVFLYSSRQAWAFIDRSL